DLRPRVVRSDRHAPNDDILGPGPQRLSNATLDRAVERGIDRVGTVELGEDHPAPSRKAAATRNGSLDTTLDAYSSMAPTSAVLFVASPRSTMRTTRGKPDQSSLAGANGGMYITRLKLVAPRWCTYVSRTCHIARRRSGVMSGATIRTSFSLMGVRFTTIAASPMSCTRPTERCAAM